MSARKASCCTRQAGSMTARRFSIVPEPPIVALVRSRPGAVRRHPSAKSRAASTRVLAMLPVRWPALRRSSNRAVIANGSRCCSPTSSAFSSWVAFGFVARAALRTSSRWQPSHRTCAGSPGWWSGRHRPSIYALPGQSGSQVPPGKPAPPHGGRLRKHRVSNSRKSPRLCYPRLPQQYRHKADMA